MCCVFSHEQAIRKSKATFPTTSNRSEYDIFVAAHPTDNSPFAHFGPTVLPWHSVYLDK